MSIFAAPTSPADGKPVPPPAVFDDDRNPSTSPDRHVLATPNSSYPSSRNPSLTRGRAVSATGLRNASPREITPATQGRMKQSLDVERRPSQSYGHHRQTSIVHGVQHSRNPSLLTNGHPGTLSPHKPVGSTALDGASTDPVFGVVKRSPSMSTLHTSGASSTAVGGQRSVEAGASQRRPERMHSGKIKRGHEHHKTQSRSVQHPQQEQKTVGEYALHHLFTSFIAEADERIERCMPKPGELEPRLENVCGPGADPAFDQLISSLGHINRHRPKALIDAVIHWRKQKANTANEKLDALHAMRNTVLLTQRPVLNGSAIPSSPPGAKGVASMERTVTLAEHRSLVSIYILCRVLIEIIGQTTLAALNESNDNTSTTAERLEDVIYGQLQSADPDSIALSPLKRANWVMRGQLLGVMSGIRLEEVANRFIADLKQAQKRLSVKGMADPKLAQKTAMLVQSMRWLRVRPSTAESWDHSCDMLHLLAKFFAEVHGRPMKHAYAELFEQLLLPVAATATSELNNAKWKDVLTILQPKITQMLSKADHWPYVFPLQAVLLCVSPADQFAAQWLPLITSFQPKARDRSGRSHALKAICRLVWRYIYRYNDSQAAVAKRLDEIVKLVFAGGKRVLISTDPAIADPLIQLIRFIGYKHQDLCFRTIVFPLMNSDLFSGPESQLKIENLDPERTVIAIRSFLAIMADIEKGEPPPFPTSFECDALMDPSSRSPITHRRSRSQGFAVSAGRTERLSRPVSTTHMNEITREYYVKFCKILGQLTIICDNTFGGQAVLDEKFATHTPKTPMAEAFTFNRKEDLTNPTDLRQHYYDLLHVAVEALPRCLSPHLPISSLVNLLCTGTAHVQAHIASSSVQSLKSIARQSHAQQVTIGFARFIFKFDDRYATVSDASLLGPGHIEGTLKLYVELLQIWIDEIQKRTKQVTTEPNADDTEQSRPLPLDLSSIFAHVDEVESHGLFFLCSPAQSVRAIAVNVLRLVTKFDTALGKPSMRIISILEGSSEEVINVNDERLSLAERSRLQKGRRKSNTDSALVELCSSDVAHDTNLWFKVFPNLIRLSSQICLNAVALTRELVCSRLSQSYRTIGAMADGNKSILTTSDQSFPGRPGGRFNSSFPDIIIEQWRNHLIFACTTLTNIGSQSVKSSQSSQHTRKSSKSSATSEDRIASATELFFRVVPFLSVQSASVRHAAVVGLGATNATLFQTLLQCLQPFVLTCNNEAKERLAPHQRTVSSPRRHRRTDYLRLEITHLLSLTCHHLRDPAVVADEFSVTYLMEYAKNLRIFLSDAEIVLEPGFNKLKSHFCVLLDGLYECTRNLTDPSSRLSFQARQAAFALMENWCGFAPNEDRLRRREDQIRRSYLERETDPRRAGFINSAFEKEKSELQLTSLSAMATLCAGPLTFVADNRILMQFDVRRLLSLINSIFEMRSDRIHAIGRKALQNLVVNNPDQPLLMASAMRMCYLAKESRPLAGYFDVVTKVLMEDVDANIPFWKILCVGLYTLGNDESEIRIKSVRLLRTLEERQGRTSKLQDLDISVSDKTTAVYKLAQFEVSRRLATQHPELAFHVFSEFSAYFNELQPDHQRNMVSAMLPWIQAIHLRLDANGRPTGDSYMLLVNLFEITVRSSIALHNEIQALWQALAAGPYSGNVSRVLEFILSLCLEKKEQSFVVYAKQIVVFLSKTPAGATVMDYLLVRVNPKAMVAEGIEAIQPSEFANLPYTADLEHVLPAGAKQKGLSLGQLCMILLVDLVVSPFSLPADKVPDLLQAILSQWDQVVSVVQEQARELLVHLVHELVISQIEPGTLEAEKKDVEDFIDAVRRQDVKISWNYTDNEITDGDFGTRAVSEPMAYVVSKVLEIFGIKYPGIQEAWGARAMDWAISCAVRHVACRSFQVYRCVSIMPDRRMLQDMMGRLSNTIADTKHHDYVVFSLEILTTLHKIVDAQSPVDLLAYPHFFWTTCACLDTVFEREFQEGLNMLSLLLTKMDLGDPAILKLLNESQPPKWEGKFQGLHALVCKGVRSSLLVDQSLAIMERLVKLPRSEFVSGDDCLLMTILANLPRFLHRYEDEHDGAASLQSAETLAAAAEAHKHSNLARVLQGFAKSNYRSQKDFLSQCMSAIRTAFFPTHEFGSLVFLLGMVNNQCAWFKVKTMQVLCVMIPDIDMRKPEIASHGPDLISPLLRLLQTEHCQQALDVLDNVIDMTGTPLDNKHLRMSMAGSHSSRALRREYDNIKSLYGIPEESGWSVPMPAIHAAQTQRNVRAVFDMLSAPGPDGAAVAATTPDIEFHKDEYQDSYFGGDRTTTMTSEDTKVDGNMGELAMKLDSLDDFFDEPTDAVTPIDVNIPRYPSGPVEELENLYDQQALPILHRSLKRNASVTSFQTGFAEVRYHPPRDPAVMNPAAFAQNILATTRPGLHNRSITSPMTLMKPPADQLHFDVTSGDEAGDEPEPFSDDDLSIGRAHTADEPYPVLPVIKPAGFKVGFRQGLRRLTSTGGGREARDVTLRAVAPRSAKVPKVPMTFLKDPTSADS